jgi:iron complex transport system ATP-binding protein
LNLEAKHISWSVTTRKIIDEISLDVENGQFVGLVGPNGSGKSSLLRVIYRIFKPDAGIVSLDGENIWQLSARQVAQKMAVVTQERGGDFDFTVEEVVRMGRNPHKGIFDRNTPADDQIVAEALRRVDLTDCARRSFSTLSGGEKQRALIARALAQQARFLVLDEPTNHLDIYYQLEILDLIHHLNVTTIAALHDLNLAAWYCDKLYVLKAGQIVASGAPQTVLTPDLILHVYGVRAEVKLHPVIDKLNITFLPGSWVN